MRPRPQAVTATDMFLAAILDEVEAQGAVLRSVLDRLPEPAVAGQPDPVPVAEPTPPGPVSVVDGPVPVVEPAPVRKPRKTAGSRTRRQQ